MSSISCQAKAFSLKFQPSPSGAGLPALLPAASSLLHGSTKMGRHLFSEAFRKRTWRPPIARNRILLEPKELEKKGEILLSGEDSRAQHIRDVLRSKPGDVVRVGVINGNAGTAEVLTGTVDGDVSCCLSLRILELGEPPRKPRLSLLLAMPRPKSMRRLWSVLGQLGLARIYITNAARVERFYFDAQALQPATVRAELLLGLEQVMQTVLPTVTVHLRLLPLLSFLCACKGTAEASDDRAAPADDVGKTLVGDPRSAFAQPPEAGVRLLYAHPGSEGSISAVLSDLSRKPSGSSEVKRACDSLLGDDDSKARAGAPEGSGLHADVAGGCQLDSPRGRAWGFGDRGEVVLAVGPEGGWTEYEVELLERLGFTQVSVGSGPLRTDVALVTLISLVKEAMDDW